MRYTLELDRETDDYFRQMAREKRTDINGIVTQGLLVMRAARDQRSIGRKHLGFVSDATKLDAELIIV